MTALTHLRVASRQAGHRVFAVLNDLAFIGSRPTDSEDEKLRKALLMGGSLMILPVAIVWGCLYLAYDERWAALITLSYAAANGTAIIYQARTGRSGPLSFVHWFCTLLLPFVLTIVLGGIAQSSALILGALMAPLGALLYHEHGAATRLFIAYAALVAVAAVVDPYVQRDNNLPQWLILTFFALNVIIVSSLAYFQLRAFLRQRDEALRLLRIEQGKSDGLLVNILPRSIADILRNEQRTIADRYDAVSILFADVVGFTPLSSAIEAEEMVNLLNEIYTHFDTVVERFGLEKIRTMGDGYMVASGVPAPRPDHAHALADGALAMMDYIDRWRSPRAADIALRMGLSSGPVLAGVIGRKKFSYDVWGDPVNIASRMESHGVPGKIQVSPSAYELLKDDFLLEARGRVQIKGKGEMDTWFLIGRR